MSDAPSATPSLPAFEALLELIRRARSAGSVAAVRFIAVNDTHLLTPYQQAALWFADRKVQALSGVIELEANAPYVQWLNRVAVLLGPTGPARRVARDDLPPDLRAEWGQWLPAEAAWVPFGAGGVLFARELPWQPGELAVLSEWLQTWHCAYRAVDRPGPFATLLAPLRHVPRAVARRPLLWTLLALGGVLFPVHLSVLAPAELVPAHPVVVRAPLDGVIKAFFVQSNQTVKAGQPLFAYDDVALAGRLQVAAEALHTAELEQRQLEQLALSDAKARGALAAAKGTVEERHLEWDFLRGQLERNRVPSPQDGVVFLDDADEWPGRPVVAGQRILRLAEPQDREIEIWLPVGDAIALAPGAPVRLYLAASPISPVSGEVRVLAYEATRRPDGSYAYRVRAKLTEASDHRVGLKGTARLEGRRVPFLYWVLRRPLASARAALGI